jgi:hypothetical protein
VSQEAVIAEVVTLCEGLEGLISDKPIEGSCPVNLTPVPMPTENVNIVGNVSSDRNRSSFPERNPDGNRRAKFRPAMAKWVSPIPDQTDTGVDYTSSGNVRIVENVLTSVHDSNYVHEPANLSLQNDSHLEKVDSHPGGSEISLLGEIKGDTFEKSLEKLLDFENCLNLGNYCGHTEELVSTVGVGTSMLPINFEELDGHIRGQLPDDIETRGRNCVPKNQKLIYGPDHFHHHP